MSPPKIFGSNLKVSVDLPLVTRVFFSSHAMYHISFHFQLLLSNIKKTQCWAATSITFSDTHPAVSCSVFLKIEYNPHLDQNHLGHVIGGIMHPPPNNNSQTKVQNSHVEVCQYLIR